MRPLYYKAAPKAPTYHSSYSGNGTTQRKHYSSGSTTTHRKSSGGHSNGSHQGSGYDPIFGNSYGTGGEQTIASGDGDINKQVGIMD